MEAERSERVRATLALTRVPGIGPVNFRRLVEAFGAAAAPFARRANELAAVEGIGGERARAIASFDGWAAVDAELARASELGLAVLCWGDEEYPERLEATYDPPPILYYKGSLALLAGPAVAVVGTRNPTSYGEDAAAFICEALAAAGVVIVSGMARGIDARAHRAALKVGGATVAVLGCGADVVYPPENKELYEDICGAGAVVSEFPPAAAPEAQNFPRRNRIISGLAAGVLVVEAGEKSGALITARHAADQGREVFAVPGSIFSRLSDGCRHLIAAGAKAVGSAEEILIEIAPQLAPASGPRVTAPPPATLEALTADERAMFERVAAQPSPADELAAALAWDAARAAAAFLGLEVAGLIEKLPGNNYRRLYS